MGAPESHPSWLQMSHMCQHESMDELLIVSVIVKYIAAGVNGQ